MIVKRTGQRAGNDFPVAIAIWQTDHSLLFINNLAAKLTGFANVELSEAAAIWGERIHVDDRAAFSYSREELREGARQSTCDYRFFPKHSKTAIRLMEVSVLTSHLQLVVSIYFRIADLSEEPKNKKTERVVRSLLHKVQNYLHVVKMEIELSELGLQSTLEVSRFVKTVSSVEQLPRDLRDYLAANATNLTIQDLERVLKKIVRRLQYQLHRQQPNLRLVRREPFPPVKVNRYPVPPVKVNRYQACRALERIVEYCELRLISKINPGHIIDVRGKPDAELNALRYKLGEINSKSPSTSLALSEQVTFKQARGKASDNLNEGLAS